MAAEIEIFSSFKNVFREDKYQQVCTKYYIYKKIARHFAGGYSGVANCRMEAIWVRCGVPPPLGKGKNYLTLML